MPQAVNPEETARSAAYSLWMQAPNPMVTFFKTVNVTRLVNVGKKRGLKFNMLMMYCVGKAAAGIPEFYLLPVGRELIRYDALAVSTIVKNSRGQVNSCDIAFSQDLACFNREYLEETAQAAQRCVDRDLSDRCMGIGTSAIIDTDIDGAVGMNSGIYNNPFLIWGRYRRKGFSYTLPLSFQFHHTQMDGAHAGRFLAQLEKEIRSIR